VARVGDALNHDRACSCHLAAGAPGAAHAGVLAVVSGLSGAAPVSQHVQLRCWLPGHVFAHRVQPPPATSSLRDTHEALLTGQYLWCHKCGSYTAGRAGLQEECIPLPESWKGCSLPPRAMWKRRQDLRGGRGPVSHGRAEGPVRVDDLERKNLADGEAEGARTGGVSRTSATKCGFSPSEEEESRHGVHTTARGYQSEMTPPSTAARGTSVAPPSCVRHASAQSEPWGGECVSTRRLADRPFWTQPVGSLVALACGASTPPSRPHSPPRHQRLQHRLQRGRRDHDAEGVQKRKRVVVEAQGRALGS
jgi:hypothetical protein